MTRGEFFRRLVGVPLVGAMAKVLVDDDTMFEPVSAQVGYIENADGWHTLTISADTSSSSTTMAWYKDGVLQSDTSPIIYGNTFG